MGRDVSHAGGHVEQVAGVREEDHRDGVGGREASVDSDGAQAAEGVRRAMVDDAGYQRQPGGPVVLGEAGTHTQGLEGLQNDVLETLHTAVAPAGMGSADVVVSA